MPVTVIHSTASAQSRVATLHVIVHELLAFLVVAVAIAMPAPHGASGDRISRGAGVPVAHRRESSAKPPQFKRGLCSCDSPPAWRCISITDPSLEQINPSTRA